MAVLPKEKNVCVCLWLKYLNFLALLISKPMNSVKKNRTISGLKCFAYSFVLLTALGWVLGGCTSAHHRRITNPEMDQWDGGRMRYVNLFPPVYGYLEGSEYDKVDFLQPGERKEHKYRILSDPRGDIDRTLGYNASDYTVTPNLSLLNSPEFDIQITWIRHATFLIQLGGKYRILMDPVLAPIDGYVGRIMKFAAIGKLYADAPVTVQTLFPASKSDATKGDKTNLVAISHDHYDHLNFNTLEQLPADTRYYVPLDLAAEFSAKFEHVTEMDWYTVDTLGDLKIYFLPANHRSGRSLNEMNQSLWGGWLLEWKGRRIYFSGDTGYSKVFKDIRNRLGDIDVCMMPITAYFQRHWHLTPEDAIQAAEDLGCSTLIPWGWGTWIMSFEHMLEPPRRLQYAWDKMQPEAMELRILKMGETFVIDSIQEDQ